MDNNLYLSLWIQYLALHFLQKFRGFGWGGPTVPFFIQCRYTLYFFNTVLGPVPSRFRGCSESEIIGGLCILFFKVSCKL